MWLVPRTDSENGKPCYCDESATGKMTHIWLDDNKWQILQREHSNGPDVLLASLPYAGGSYISFVSFVKGFHLATR